MICEYNGFSGQAHFLSLPHHFFPRFIFPSPPKENEPARRLDEADDEDEAELIIPLDHHHESESDEESDDD